MTALVQRIELDPERIDDVILGQGYPSSEAPPIGRVVALDAGLPTSVPGMQVDRRCGSGLQAVISAAQAVRAGDAQVVVAGGVDSMSNVPHYSVDVRWGTSGSTTLHDALGQGRVTAGGRYYPVAGGMLETAENLRREYGISRQAQDNLAVRSHARAVAAQASGIFSEEIIPVTVVGPKGPVVVDVDEHPRPGTDMESLSRLKPVLRHDDLEATVTAGNASGQNDAAAMCIVTTRACADELGLRAYVRLVSTGLAGVGPATMGIGPVPARTSAPAGRAHPHRS